jgi:hypothetical protein
MAAPGAASMDMRTAGDAERLLALPLALLLLLLLLLLLAWLVAGEADLMVFVASLHTSLSLSLFHVWAWKHWKVWKKVCNGWVLYTDYLIYVTTIKIVQPKSAY